MPNNLYVSKQLSQIKRGGWPVLKYKIKGRILMFINLPYYLIALPFVIIIRIIWPFIKIRFGPIRNDVIGHFAFDTEYYLSERAINNSETIDLFFFQSRNSPNIQWELMVKRFFKTHILFKYCNNIYCLFK